MRFFYKNTNKENLILFNNDYKPVSTSRQAKKIIRDEINYYYPDEIAKIYGCKTGLDVMKKDADALFGGFDKSDWDKGKKLADYCCFACSLRDKSAMLRKIYGEKVYDWDGNKIRETYSNLIGREYAEMLRERKK